MKNDDNILNRRKFKIALLVVLGLIVAIAINTSILAGVNRRVANDSADVVLNQVVKALTQKEETETLLIAELKEEYMDKAEAVSYILDLNPELENNLADLIQIATLMDIDEIHLFNEKGEIYGGTVPQYYGYSFDSGDQISYFKPMLEDKNLSMCQDLTPNTVEEKTMMYAITWNKAGTKMIQVGIEPVRLREELRQNSIDDMVYSIPVYEGASIIVSNAETGVIYGATDKNLVGEFLHEAVPKLSQQEVKEEDGVVSGHFTSKDRYLTYYKCTNIGYYQATALYSTSANVNNFLVYVVIELVYLIMTAVVFCYMIFKVINANNEKDNQLSILISMADIYFSMHLIDLISNSAEEYRSDEKIKRLTEGKVGADYMLREVMPEMTVPEHAEQVLAFTDLRSLRDRMQGRKIITEDFVGNRYGWYRASFITIEQDENQKPTKVIFATRNIDKDKRKEESLIKKSNTDELTGLLNRRAYEDAISELNEEIKEDNFVYVSIDVNGLKSVNDTLGHVAGDELLSGAAECMKRCMGAYGKVYRIGGDEFVALIFASETALEEIKKDFDEAVMNWSGVRVNQLAVSCGYVTKREAGATSIHEVSVLADQRMYEAKTEYYRKKGIDRRGRKEAHVALCNLYTKILRVNLTKDTYTIINMDEKEALPELPRNLSDWMREFGVSGQVHPDDLTEYLAKTDISYLQQYFKEGNLSLSVFYRRKYGDVYKQAIMELIPTGDYSNLHQTLFLYVKEIEMD